MRISDWSSDVCSSDLQVGVRPDDLFVEGRDVRRTGGELGQVAAGAAHGAEELLALGRVGGADVATGRDAEGARVEGDLLELAILDPIGRASCRERVCQYV